MKPFQAVLFDFDGVIAHTAPAFRQALWTFLREKQIQAVQEDFEENGNFTMSLKQSVELLKAKYGYDIDLAELRARIGPLQIELLDKHLEFDPSLPLYLEHCQRQGIKIAIGSNAFSERINWVLEKMKIREYFSVVLGAGDIQNHKPDPEVWIRCAEELNVPITECMVIENGLPGLT
jgi:beta-phosphoglucomutase-like phosphatase (HAD superfamily)